MYTCNIKVNQFFSLIFKLCSKRINYRGMLTRNFPICFICQKAYHVSFISNERIQITYVATLWNEFAAESNSAAWPLRDAIFFKVQPPPALSLCGIRVYCTRRVNLCAATSYKGASLPWIQWFYLSERVMALQRRTEYIFIN
jgi:hypothetical protein